MVLFCYENLSKITLKTSGKKQYSHDGVTLVVTLLGHLSTGVLISRKMFNGEANISADLVLLVHL